MFGTNSICEFVRQFSPITAKSVSKAHQLIDMVATHDFYPVGEPFECRLLRKSCSGKMKCYFL